MAALIALKEPKSFIKLVAGNAMIFTLEKLNNDSMIGSNKRGW